MKLKLAAGALLLGTTIVVPSVPGRALLAKDHQQEHGNEHSNQRGSDRHDQGQANQQNHSNQQSDEHGGQGQANRMNEGHANRQNHANQQGDDHRGQGQANRMNEGQASQQNHGDQQGDEHRGQGQSNRMNEGQSKQQNYGNRQGYDRQNHGQANHENQGAGYHFRQEDAPRLRQQYSQINSIDRDRRPRYSAGQHLPEGWHQRIRSVPTSLYRELPPPPPGYRMGYIDGYAVAYNPTTQIIADVLDLVATASGR